MVLHDPVSPGTDALARDLQHRRLGIRRLRQWHALRRLGDAVRSDDGAAGGRNPLPRNRRRHPADDPRRRFFIHRRHGRAALSAGTRSRCGDPFPTPARSTYRSAPHEAPLLQAARPSSTWATRTRSSSSKTSPAYDLGAIGPAARTASDLPGARQHLPCGGRGPRAHRPARLGARRRPHPRLRLGRLRRPRRRRAQKSHRTARPGSACPAAIFTSPGAKRTITC